MQKLTVKEEELMNHFWINGPAFVRELLERYPDPKPHFNTLSTTVRGLEDKGFLSHNIYGNTYQYFAIISEQDYKKSELKTVVKKYFHNSYLGVVSSLIEEEKVSLEELRKLISQVENTSKK